MTATISATDVAGTSERATEVVRGFDDALAGGEAPGIVAFLGRRTGAGLPAPAWVTEPALLAA